MGLAHSPRIVTDNLVFYYDMGNTQKSWRGAPTTNLIDNPLPNETTTGYTASGGSGTLTYDSTNKAIKWVRTAYETWGAYNTVAPVFNGNLDTSSQYTISFEWKTENTAVSNAAYSYNLVQGNGQSAAASANLLTNSTLQSNGWYLFKYTFTPANTGVSAINRVILGTQSTNVSTFYWRKIQFEKIGFATPFVVGTRSNTQAILDLTNNNTVTATSLTYNSDGTFSFNGSSNYITLNSILSAKPFTISFWTKLNSIKNQGFYSSRTVLGSGISIFGLAAGGIRFDTGDNQWTPAYTLETNKWINIVVSIDVANKYLYINGVFHSSTSYASTINNISSSIATVGASQVEGTGYDNYVDGDISGYIIYNRALSAAEISQNFQALRGRYGI
jgi:hypothetical protein